MAVYMRRIDTLTPDDYNYFISNCGDVQSIYRIIQQCHIHSLFSLKINIFQLQ